MGILPALSAVFYMRVPRFVSHIANCLTVSEPLVLWFIVSSTTGPKRCRSFCSLRGSLQAQIPVALYRCLGISVNCEMEGFLWQFQSIGRSFANPRKRRESDAVLLQEVIE